MLAGGDDTIRIIVETGRLRESPLGSTFRVSKTARQYVPVTASDLDAGFVRGVCISALHKALSEVTEGLR
jgi:hypothetical protein